MARVHREVLAPVHQLATQTPLALVAPGMCTAFALSYMAWMMETEYFTLFYFLLEFELEVEIEKR